MPPVLPAMRCMLRSTKGEAIESVFGNADALTKDGCLKRLGGKVTFHLLDVRLAEQLQVLNRGVLLIIDGNRAHLVEIAVKLSQIVSQIARYRFTIGIEPSNAFLGLPYLIDGTFYRLDKVSVHLVLIVKEPRAFLRLRHITEYHY